MYLAVTLLLAIVVFTLVGLLISYVHLEISRNKHAVESIRDHTPARGTPPDRKS
jgi:hypothetical protein